ncbi:MAG: dimethylsulfonioproprionate lyase family protein [Actinomycetota bacterium]
MDQQPMLQPLLTAVDDVLATAAMDHELAELHAIGRSVTESAGVQAVDPSCPPLLADLLAEVETDHLHSPDRRLVEELVTHASHLRWLHPYPDYDERDIVDFRERYFYTTIVGSRDDGTAPLFSDRFSLFLTVQGPQVFYPSHVHKAPEFYRTIAGTGEWQKGGGPFAATPPGRWIVHPTGTRHAMRSLDNPMVALAVWTNDLDSVPVIVRN